MTTISELIIKLTDLRDAGHGNAKVFATTSEIEPTPVSPAVTVEIDDEGDCLIRAE